MIVQTPVIGIPNWDWKKDLTERSERKPNICLLPISDFCHECERHKSMLACFDNDDDNSKDNAYYAYHRKVGRNASSIRKRIKKFRTLYESIKKKGCQVPPAVTVDGCRLNGSHRIAILNHLGVEESNINVVRYEEHYDDKKSQAIRKQVMKYRQEIYQL